MAFSLRVYHHNEDEPIANSYKTAVTPEEALNSLAALQTEYSDPDYIVVVNASSCSDKDVGRFSAGAKERGLMFRRGR